MNLKPKIFAAFAGCLFSAAAANAQGYQNKKATAVQTFTLKLTKPASTQVDLAQTAGKYLNTTGSTSSTASVGETNQNSLTVTEVSSAPANAGSEARETNNAVALDKVQVITLSKA